MPGFHQVCQPKQILARAGSGAVPCFLTFYISVKLPSFIRRRAGLLTNLALEIGAGYS